MASFYNSSRSISFLTLSPFITDNEVSVRRSTSESSFFANSQLIPFSSYYSPPGISQSKNKINNKKFLSLTNEDENSKLEKKNLFKTEMCLSVERGEKCRYGNRCNFAHSIKELRSIQKHPLYKTEKCKAFSITGYCPYGRRCCFLHGEK